MKFIFQADATFEAEGIEDAMTKVAKHFLGLVQYMNDDDGEDNADQLDFRGHIEIKKDDT